MIRKILTGLLGLIILLFALGFILPAQRHVERSATINASAEELFALTSDFGEWQKWSPWATIDPDAEFTLTGTGINQKMVWSSEDPKVGKGSQTFSILDPTHIQTKLDFGDMGLATADFTFEEAGNGATNVTWSLDTNMREGVPFLMKPMGTYMGFFMDGMVGPDYEKGLASLKTVAEAE